ncbi:DNA cytosine methyltransferase [Actinacidiphila paucisporea]|uniref:DNA (cytosine-5-)-methyltransferase n=1 Tax=Actinacidiphila paucisporea TaxID=310782 RepID=A0A1M7C8G4_9ACTN|nr:DNA (cytosine-5-)-methyltransferase [Actinacidiphila paucisporea]SHL63480.1 DNA (cytosine-5)-methyltransferase 1 [Actinacidiphila paucisporea]
MAELRVVEICAGAGGQALGLERAGFEHELAVELDSNAVKTLRHNRKDWKVEEGDVADPKVWRPEDHRGKTDLLAGGVPCPPFTIAGKQLGATDERDLFAWAVRQVRIIQPKALMLENVRGLSANRFAAYRQHVLDELRRYDYVASWRLLQASDFGVPQLRPRFVLVALQREFAPYFTWPEPLEGPPPTVGETLKDLMASNGWEGADAWAEGAASIAPTIVGGSKKHGGADLGPSRAKAAWEKLGVDGWGVENAPPEPGWTPPPGKPGPKLTCEMVARIQGWNEGDWHFTGGKTTQYRQIGNAFPPPVAEAVGRSIHRALSKEGEKVDLVETTEVIHDPVYKLLHGAPRPVGMDQIITKLQKAGVELTEPEVEQHLAHLERDFVIERAKRSSGAYAYTLGEFRAFVGQEGHERHERFAVNKSRIS